MLVATESSPDRREGPGREVDRLGDGAPVVGVEVGLWGDGPERHPVVGGLPWTVPEVAPVDGHVVSVLGETGTDLVDPLLGSTRDERVDDVRDEGNAHYPSSVAGANGFSVSRSASRELSFGVRGVCWSL